MRCVIETEEEEFPQFVTEVAEALVTLAGGHQEGCCAKLQSLLHSPKICIELLKTILQMVSDCERIYHKVDESTDAKKGFKKIVKRKRMFQL